jgi:NADH:ubiquinone reductase (H+-translocating)
VEMAGQIAEIARDTRKDFRVADTSKAVVMLIEAGPRLLAAFPPRLSAKAARSLRRLGVTPLTGHEVTGLDETGVVVRDGERQRRIAARTIIWAAGVLACEIAGELAKAAGAETDRAGRIVVEPDLSVPGHAEVIAIGDMAAVSGKPPFPGLAPAAMQMGRHAAALVRARLRGRRVGDFVYRDKGNLATIGRARAVADIRGLQASGFPAWVLWLGVHLWFLMGFQHRLFVFLEWVLSFVRHGRQARLITGREAALDATLEATRPARHRPGRRIGL